MTMRTVKKAALFVYIIFPLLALALLIACSQGDEAATATALISPTSQPTDAATAMPGPSPSTLTAVPTQTAVAPTNTPTADLDPYTPAPATMSNEVEGWYLYRNETRGYRISYPPVAVMVLYGDVCLRTVLYESGFLQITAETTANLPDACQLSSASDAPPQPEMIRLAGQTMMAEKQAGPLYRATLPNGLQIAYGLLPHVDPESTDAQVALAVIGDMLDSVRFMGEVSLAQVTPTPTPVACLDDAMPVAEPPAGWLRIVYEANGQTWEWREETGTAVPLEAEAVETDGVLSADGRFRVSLRQPDADQFELWLSAADGSNPRRLLTLSPDEIFARYPQATGARLVFDWVAATSLISYRFVPESSGLGGFPIQTVRIVDAETGHTWPVLPPDEAWTYRFTEDGRTLIVLTEEGVQIINTIDGVVRFDIPLDVVVPFDQGIDFIPDGRVMVYTAAGVTLVNPSVGAFVEIPLDYEPVGAGHYSILPPVHWLDDETQFYTVTTTDDVWNDTRATFTVWRVDTAVHTATPLNTFTGFYPSVAFSPDYRWIAFWPQSRDNMRRLYLANVVTGEQIFYDALHSLEFIGWSPDGTQFLYKAFASTQPILGHICAASRPLSGVKVDFTSNVKWIDNERLLILEGTPDSEQPRPLRLVTLDGQSTLIATLTGDYPAFRFYFEEPTDPGRTMMNENP